jgi:DNA (cytosine-5)-methyltransferase 1
MTLTVGSLCTGYGGLELGLAVAGVPHVLEFVADTDKAASAVLAARFTGVPNLGDLRETRWPEVDLITAGFPCQPVSAAGRRAGLEDGRWLFDDIAEGIGAMGRARPRLLWFENVPGLLSANRGHAMARVVHRLASLGYVGRYGLLRAADVGAPHRRERVFIAAHLAHTKSVRLGNGRAASVSRVPAAAVAGDTAALLPTPTTREASGPGRLDGYRNDTLRAQVALLKTPTASLAVNGGSQHPDKRRDGGHGPTLADGVEFLLPTPIASNGVHGGPNQRGSSGDLMLPAAVQPEHWGQFAAAVARWEHVLGRAAPAPTEPSPKGAQRLSARFVEWMLGLPDGHVCDVAGLSRNEQLHVLGNGVVPQQFAAALATLGQP